MNVYSLVLLSLSLEIEYRVGKSADINLALNRTATYCDDPTPLTWLTDGDTNLSMEISKTCTEYSYVEIYLGDQYFVHYVIIYEGILGRDDSEELSMLHRFVVDGINNDNKIDRCGMYNRRIEPGNIAGMRVNCKVGQFRKVRISSHSNEGFVLAEIEVYTIGSKLTNDIRGILHSCIENVSHTPLKRDDCYQHCWKEKKIIVAKKGGSCVCMSEYNFMMEAEKLKSFAKGCGKTNFMAHIVRPQLPYYTGCYNTSHLYYNTSIRDISTPSKCIMSCSNFSFSGIKQGRECLCIRAIGNPVDEYESCNTFCGGDVKTFCGGPDHASVFGNIDKITKYFQCSGDWDEYGVCLGPCKEFYGGDYCLELLADFVSDKINSEISLSALSASKCPVGHCKHKPNTECKKIGNDSECVCVKGFFNRSGSCVVNRSAIIYSDIKISKFNYMRIVYALIPVLGLFFTALFVWFVAPPETDEETGASDTELGNRSNEDKIKVKERKS